MITSTTVEICVLLGTSADSPFSSIYNSRNLCTPWNELPREARGGIYNSRNLCTPWNVSICPASGLHLQQQKFVYSLEQPGRSTARAASTTVEICVLLGTDRASILADLSTTVEICVLLGTPQRFDQTVVIYNSRNLCTPWNTRPGRRGAWHLQQQKFVYSLELRLARIFRGDLQQQKFVYSLEPDEQATLAGVIYNSRNLCTPWNELQARGPLRIYNSRNLCTPWNNP